MDRIAPGALVYIDTNIFIYLIEADSIFYRKARDVFIALEAANARIATSEIAVAECLYQPAKTGNDAAIDAYERLFSSGEIELIPLDGALAKRSAMRGGELELKLIDAIHYFSALEFGCEVFITNDARIRPGPKMRVALPLRS